MPAKQYPTIGVEETLTLNNDIADVDALNRFQKSVYERIGLDKPTMRQMQLAVEEAVVNVMEYAYPKGTKGEITVEMTYDSKHLNVRISDQGMAFDPTATESADTSLSAEDREIGGLGILLVRELVDAVDYERRQGRNMLTLTKTIEQDNKQ